MKQCDLCGKEVTVLGDINPDYKQLQIKHCCGGCDLRIRNLEKRIDLEIEDKLKLIRRGVVYQFISDMLIQKKVQNETSL